MAQYPRSDSGMPPHNQEHRRKRKLHLSASGHDDATGNSSKKHYCSSSSLVLAQRQPLDHILELCGGTIVDNVPNIQLIHMMMVYGQCGGNDGICMETVQDCQELQTAIYNRYMRELVATLSPSQACNMQHLMAPNDWTDVFCRILLDQDSWKQYFHSENGSLEPFFQALEAVCKKCMDLCMMHMQPSMCICVPRHARKGVPRSREDLSQWISQTFIPWVASIYEAYSLFRFDRESKLPAPSEMGLTAREFAEWQHIVHGLANRRLQYIKKKLIPSMLAGGDGMEDLLGNCWRQAIFLQKELTNIVLFYIAYPIRRQGDIFMKDKFQLLHEGKLPLHFGSSKITVADMLSSQDMMIVNRRVLPHAGKAAHQSAVTPPLKLGQMVQEIMGCGATKGEVAQVRLKTTSTPSVKLVLFAHGFMHLLAEEVPSLGRLQEVCMLDRPGIKALRNAFECISFLVAVLPKGYEEINKHMASDPKQCVMACVLNLQCLQAFTELVLRTAHFRIFGTGKKHLVDACNMLLRTGGHTLCNSLLNMLKSEGRQTTEICKRKAVAMQTICSMASSWIGILMVAGCGPAHNNNNKAFNITREDFKKEACKFDDSTFFGRTVHCILQYAEDEATHSIRSSSSSPVAQAFSDVEYDSLDDEEEEDAQTVGVGGTSSSRVPPPLPRLPHLYMQLSQEQNLLDYDITLPRRPNSEMGHAWDFCWKQLGRGSNEGAKLSLFRPLLLHVCMIASNIVKANAFYMLDHIVDASS